MPGVRKNGGAVGYAYGHDTYVFDTYGSWYLEFAISNFLIRFAISYSIRRLFICARASPLALRPGYSIFIHRAVHKSTLHISVVRALPCGRKYTHELRVSVIAICACLVPAQAACGYCIIHFASVSSLSSMRGLCERETGTRGPRARLPCCHRTSISVRCSSSHARPHATCPPPRWCASEAAFSSLVLCVDPPFPPIDPTQHRGAN